MHENGYTEVNEHYVVWYRWMVWNRAVQELAHCTHNLLDNQKGWHAWGALRVAKHHEYTVWLGFCGHLRITALHQVESTFWLVTLLFEVYLHMHYASLACSCWETKDLGVAIWKKVAQIFEMLPAMSKRTDHPPWQTLLFVRCKFACERNAISDLTWSKVGFLSIKWYHWCWYILDGFADIFEGAPMHRCFQTLCRINGRTFHQNTLFLASFDRYGLRTSLCEFWM